MVVKLTANYGITQGGTDQYSELMDDKYRLHACLMTASIAKRQHERGEIEWALPGIYKIPAEEDMEEFYIIITEAESLTPLELMKAVLKLRNETGINYKYKREKRSK